MKTLQVFGPGCARCRLLSERAQAAARELGLEVRVEKVTDLDALLAAGITVTPALAVDGAIKVMGRVPTVDHLRRLIG